MSKNLCRAQRDDFGAHTYERTDKPGSFPSKWAERRGPAHEPTDEPTP